MQTRGSGTNQSPLFIPLKGLTELNLPKVDLNLILCVLGRSLCWLLNADKVSSVIDGPKWPRRYFIKSETWLKLHERFLVRFLRFRSPGFSNLMVWLDKGYAGKLSSYKTNTRLSHYTSTHFIKNILYLVLFLFVFLLFYLFCGEYDIGGS